MDRLEQKINKAIREHEKKYHKIISKSKEEYISIFDEARKLFPGTKRGCQVELDDFRRKHRDWKDVLPLLKPAIENQIAWRKSAKEGEFRPDWKNFKTWLFQRCWTEVHQVAVAIKIPSKAVPIPDCCVCHDRGYKSDTDQQGKIVALCYQCCKGWYKIKQNAPFGIYLPNARERIVLEGKAKLKPEPAPQISIDLHKIKGVDEPVTKPKWQQRKEVLNS